MAKAKSPALEHAVETTAGSDDGYSFMVEPPATATVNIDLDDLKNESAGQKRERSAEHGITCQCGSTDVLVRTTRSRPNHAYRPSLTQRVLNRSCVCLTCGIRFRRDSLVTEVPLNASR